jgi:tetratricopeptide (TPR) repeat protein
MMAEGQWGKATPYLALARFGMWEDVLREPAPGDEFLFMRVVYHYARGLAHARRKELPEAEGELALLAKVAADERVAKLETPTFPGPAIVQVYRTLLAAEVAGAKGKPEELKNGLQAAIQLQDKIPYMEPPYFYMPLRQRLGAVLVEQGSLKEAEAVYREDLKRNPENGWSLYGLLQCLRAAGKAEAIDVERRFREAWKHADVMLTASAF